MGLCLDLTNGSRVIKLSAGQVLIFGYGSLLLRESMEATLGQRYDETRYICELQGWRRSWDVFMPNEVFYEPGPVNDFVPANIIYLNIKPSADCSVNGLLYRLEENQIEAFDKREWIYDRVDITSRIRGVTVEGGEAYIYTSKPEWLMNPAHTCRQRAALRRTYVEMIERGVSLLGAAFRDQFELSTDPVPNHLVFSDVRRLIGHV